MIRPQHARDDTGAYREQLTLLPEPPFYATLPAIDTLAMDALRDLVNKPALMQRDWLTNGKRKSWRLAAVIHGLKDLGWSIETDRVDGQAKYRLKPKARQAAYKALKALDASKAKGVNHGH